MKCIFAYTPHVIMPPYVNIYQYGERPSNFVINLRTQGARDVSQMEIGRDALRAMAESILEYLEEEK